jgi:hypothetical protein
MGPMGWVISLPLACHLIPMWNLVALKLGKLFFLVLIGACRFLVNFANWGSFLTQNPHLDGQDVSTKLSACNDIHANQNGATLLLDPTLFSNGPTDFPNQDPIGFDHWDGFQADTVSTSLNFGSTQLQNAIGFTDSGYSGRSMGKETTMYQARMTNPMYIPTDAPAGFYDIPHPSMMDLNPQHPYGLMAQIPIASVTANFNFGEASASTTNTPMPIAAPMPQAPVTQTVPTPGTMPCTWCPMTFKRKHERDRHAASVHGINHKVYLCHVNGCPKNRGTPFSRQDKLTEHMWKKHRNLGYGKRAV